MIRIISMQDIRVSLATIANQVQEGDTFVVVRNSKPVFKIIQPDEPALPRAKTVPSLKEITKKLDAAKKGYDLSPSDLDMIIHEAHGEYGRK
ncbi:MAG: hypothetical protein JXN60_02655 [Lentisphaerae bacterium]|nr:hypothetical protein [Lentisphaerota bacterium]